MGKNNIIIESTLRSCDMFGDQIGFKVKGAKAYRSVPGALLSILIFVLLVIHGVNRWMENQARLNESKSTEVDGLNQPEVHDQSAIDFLAHMGGLAVALWLMATFIHASVSFIIGNSVSKLLIEGISKV